MTDTTELIERLRERLQLRYMGNCKCGHCQLVPVELIAETADALSTSYRQGLEDAAKVARDYIPDEPGPEGYDIADRILALKDNPNG